MQIAVHQIVTYASDAFGGNPAFVIVLRRREPISRLQQICGTLSTGMIATLLDDGETLEFACVTPDGLHPGAGHATHAAAWVALNRLRPGAAALELKLSGGGRRSIRAAGEQIEVDWPIISYRAAAGDPALPRALGLAPRECFDSSFGVVALLESEEQVLCLEPDLDGVARLPYGAVIAAAPATRADIAVRVFAPKFGLPEDPVCGTAHRILAPLFAEWTRSAVLVSHQLSRRGGELVCRLAGEGVAIGGRATPFLDGIVHLPDTGPAALPREHTDYAE